MRLEIDPRLLKEELIGTYASPQGTKFPKEIEISITAFVNSLTGFVELGIDRNWIFDRIGNIILDRWLKEGEIYYIGEDIERAVSAAAIQTAADELIEQGILDAIEDENGEDVLFITDKGKEYAEKWGIGRNNSKKEDKSDI